MTEKHASSTTETTITTQPAMSGSEPFPLLNTANDQLHQRRFAPSSSVSNTTATEASISDARRRRKSSALGGEIRGDTGAPALASSRASLDAVDKSSQVSLSDLRVDFVANISVY